MQSDDQKRVFLAVALSIGVLIGWTMLFSPDPPPEGSQETAGEAGEQPAGENGGETADNPPTGPTESPTDPRSDDTPPVKPAKKIPLEDVEIVTEKFRAVFTNEGARLLHFSISDPAQYVPRGNLVAPEEAPEEEPNRAYLPFGSTTKGESIALPERAMYEVVERSPASVTFRYTDPGGKYQLTKHYEVDPDKPLSFRVNVVVENRGGAALSDQLSLVFYAYQNPEDEGWSLTNPLPNNTEGLCYADNDAERAPLDDATEGMTVPGPVTWGGTDDRYFMTSAIFDEPFAGCAFSVREEGFIRTELSSNRFTVEPGQKHELSMSAYVGPKDLDRMALFEADLGQSVDYGVFAILCRPIRWLLVFYYTTFVQNWGVAIILLTITLRLMMFPINQKGYKNMEGMRQLQEPMKELRAKYENDPAKLQAETMKLYKDNNVSMLGCLPQLLQIPIFFALYRTIYSSVELYHADFFGWYTDLSAPDPYYVLPVLVGVAMFGQQLLMPTTAANPQMKYMMWAMPIIFSAFTFVLPSGLALYILVSVFLGVAQQWVIRRGFKKDDEQTADAAPEKKESVKSKRKKKKSKGKGNKPKTSSAS